MGERLGDASAYRAVRDEIAAELRVWIEPEVRERIIRIFTDKFLKLVVVVLNDPTAGAGELGMRLEPSDLLLRLAAAVRAHDRDDIAVIEHEIASPVAASE
jgi:hypothetical protein